MIRPATERDIDSILTIWNPVIRNSVFTFNSKQKSRAELITILNQKHAAGDPFFVAEMDKKLVGFATYGQFRGGVGYQFTVEHTIIVADGMSGHGIGRALLLAVEEHAKQRGMHSMIAGVSGENTAGISFHAALGYTEIARIPEVGRKFERWFDLVLMQKRL